MEMELQSILFNLISQELCLLRFNHKSLSDACIKLNDVIESVLELYNTL